MKGPTLADCCYYERNYKNQKLSKNKASEITEIQPKFHDIELSECSFKNRCSAAQMTSNSKWFSHITNHIRGISLVIAFAPLYLLNSVHFCLFQFHHSKNETVLKKQIHMYLSFINPKTKILLDFSVFVFNTIPTAKIQKWQKLHKSSITLKYDNVASKEVAVLFKRHETQNDWTTLPSISQVFVLWELDLQVILFISLPQKETS